MDSLAAMALGRAAAGKPHRVFDWEKAAQLIKDSGATAAAAGLRDDWEYTGDTILIDGKPVKSPFAYLSSNWAIPELTLGDGAPVECWRWESETPGWGAKTSWPPEALAVLGVEVSP